MSNDQLHVPSPLAATEPTEVVVEPLLQDTQGADVHRDRAVDRLRAQVLDGWDAEIAICNCLYAVQAIRDEHMAAAFARAVNARVIVARGDYRS